MAAVTVGELVQHLSSPRAAGTLLLLRSLEPVREDDRTSEAGVRSAERRLVDEALPTAPPANQFGGILIFARTLETCWST